MGKKFSKPGFREYPLGHLRSVFGRDSSLRGRIQAKARKLAGHSDWSFCDTSRSGGRERVSRHDSREPGDHYCEDSSRCPGRHAVAIQRQGPTREKRGARWRFLHPASCEVASPKSQSGQGSIKKKGTIIKRPNKIGEDWWGPSSFPFLMVAPPPPRVEMVVPV